MIGKGSAPAVPGLLRLLESSDEVRRRGALFGLAAIGVYDDEARMQLRPFLRGNDVQQRALAALALARPGGPIDEAVPVLIQLAVKTGWREAIVGESQGAEPASAPAASPPQVGATLGSLMWAVAGREDADGLLPILIAMDQTVYASTNQWRLHRQLIAALASLGPAAVPGLIAELQNDDLRARAVAAEVLGAIGPAASDATPHLVRMLHDDEVWDAAAAALGRIGNGEALPKLLDLLEALQAPSDRGEDDSDDDETGEYDPYEEEFVSILTALGSRGAEARTAAPVVLALANADDPEVRYAAIKTLARIDPDNPLLDRHLRRWLAEWERSAATDDSFSFDSSFDGLADSLRRLGPRAESFANDLHRLMASAPLAQPKVRCYAAFALAASPAHRQKAEDYLRSLTTSELSNSFESLNLADALLRRIAGDEQKSWMQLSMPFGVGP
jgi:HEAT repeat protein